MVGATSGSKTASINANWRTTFMTLLGYTPANA